MGVPIRSDTLNCPPAHSRHPCGTLRGPTHTGRPPSRALRAKRLANVGYKDGNLPRHPRDTAVSRALRMRAFPCPRPFARPRRGSHSASGRHGEGVPRWDSAAQWLRRSVRTKSLHCNSNPLPSHNLRSPQRPGLKLYRVSRFPRAFPGRVVDIHISNPEDSRINPARPRDDDTTRRWLSMLRGRAP